MMSSSIRVFLTDPPDPPFITVVSSVLSLNITWSSSVEENIIRILDYRIKVFDAIKLKRIRQYNGITSSSLVIENLKRNRTYIVIIEARNEVGYGKSTNVSATTLLAGTTISLTCFSRNLFFFQSSQPGSFCVPVCMRQSFGATLKLKFIGWKFRCASSNGQKPVENHLPAILFARDLTNKQISYSRQLGAPWSEEY